jgi:hypothetical protein
LLSIRKCLSHSTRMQGLKKLQVIVKKNFFRKTTKFIGAKQAYMTCMSTNHYACDRVGAIVTWSGVHV